VLLIVFLNNLYIYIVFNVLGLGARELANFCRGVRVFDRELFAITGNA
jgi:hypothetical protein